MDEQPVPSSPLVTIDDDVFGPGLNWRTADDMREQRDASWVLFSADPRAAAEALHRASRQFPLVDENGGIHSQEDVETGAVAEYTPNYVASVRIFAEGAHLYVDTKGMLFPGMARTMMRLIIIEVEKAGVAVRIGDESAADYYSRSADYSPDPPPH